jgi:Flp pilus assembly protein TadG
MLLLMVTMGALQYGWAFYCLQRATNAARHGARMAAVVNADVAAAKTEMLALVSDLNPTGASDISVDTVNGTVTGIVVIPAAKAQLIQWNLLPVPELRPTVTMRREGP